METLLTGTTHYPSVTSLVTGSSWTTDVTTLEPTPVQKYSLAVGFISVAVATVLFGSNLVPVKKFETGDGMFFQFILCTAIWLSGLVLNGIKGFPKFHPLAMLGGFLWCTGNVMVVPILKTVGLSQGMLIWASVNLLSGWAAGRFGWFYMKPQEPADEPMNICGVVLCLVSAVVYMFLKTNTSHPAHRLSDGSNHPPLIDTNSPTEITVDPKLELQTVEPHAAVNGAEEVALQEKNKAHQTRDVILNSSIMENDSRNEPIFYEKFSPVVRRAFGIAMAVAAGILFGLNFTPVIYMQDNCIGASTDGLDYVFSHFCGIFATSTVYLAIYCAFMRNRPRVYANIILPGLASGAMWAIADIGWFIANDALSQPISFPIITALPAIIGALWGMLAFGEIRGKRNYIVLTVAIVFAVTGSVLTGLSKMDLSHEHKNVTRNVWTAKYNCTHL